MPDKKLTDSEIKKALEDMVECNADKTKSCNDCVLNKHYPYCEKVSFELALDLINRLQDKNKAYKYYYDECLKDLKKSNKEIKKLRYNLEAVLDERADHSEAYKECIEKVKEISKYETYCDNRLSAPIITYHITEDNLDNLLKEMVGEDNESKNK